jgi:SpoVK/Ycf46/Vps4 family AAA+-type ATPase
VEGSIIRVFDPVIHEAFHTADDEEQMLQASSARDRRWEICRRPLVKTGGELDLEALDISFDRRSGYYRAPLQLAANGGMLLIDDFGRQRCPPRDLLNRWMVPLESRTDHMRLDSGLTFEVPFHVLVAFATNIKPSELVDEAFLRRVRYKVFANSPSVEDFMLIFERCCDDRAVPFDRGMVEQLLSGYYRQHDMELRACQPRDLISQALVLAAYRGQPRVLTLELLEAACAAYFVADPG